MIHNVDPQLTQWDVGRIVTISDSNATHIHFANQGDSKAVIIEIENGSAKIPDYLLQTGKTVIAYAVKDGVTLESKSFSVRKRERPENYVYEDDQRNYIYELITDAENAVASANTATENANMATSRANTAATNADVATNSANLATTKANTATDNANLAAKNANEAVTKANNAVKNMMVVGGAEGGIIALDDAIDQTLVGLRVFGKTKQNGTPTPDAPVELVSVGDSGSITVNVAGENDAQSITIATPNGLPGVPVASGGNYTDANGQQWVCDEIDFARGVYVQRTNKYCYTGNEAWEKSNIQGSALSSDGLIRYDAIPNPHQPKASRADVLSSHCLFAGTNAYNKDSGMSVWVGFDNNVSYLTVRIAADFDTTEVLKSWLVEQNALGTPLVILYALATPIETPLSEEELAAYANLHTYKDHTTVSNDAGAWMELEYVMDAKKYIDSIVGTGGTILPARVE